MQFRKLYLGMPLSLLKERLMDDVGDARIKSLNLTANNIGDKGALALAEMLKV